MSEDEVQSPRRGRAAKAATSVGRPAVLSALACEVCGWLQPGAILSLPMHAEQQGRLTSTVSRSGPRPTSSSRIAAASFAWRPIIFACRARAPLLGISGIDEQR